MPAVFNALGGGIMDPFSIAMVLSHTVCVCRSENVAKQVQEVQQKLLDMEKAMEIKAATIEVVKKEVGSCLVSAAVLVTMGQCLMIA